MNLRHFGSTAVLGWLVGGAGDMASAQAGTWRVSVSSSGTQGNRASDKSSVSADGRFVAFTSSAFNLVPRDGNSARDVFVRDLETGATERVSVNSAGSEGNGSCDDPSISADGRFVAFSSYASNLVSGDTNVASDVFVHDRQSGTTERVSVDSAGAAGNGDSYSPSISADGWIVAFTSRATNLVSGDTNKTADVFVHDRQRGLTERVSVDSVGSEGNDMSEYGTFTSDGSIVAFDSFASNLVSGDTNAVADVFLHDRRSGVTERVSVDSAGNQGDNSSQEPSINADGRYVSFWSYASDLVPGDANLSPDVFVHDCQAATTDRVSVDSSGAEGNSGSYRPSLSADGHVVAFDSFASNLVSGDTNGTADVFVHDRLAGSTLRVSIDSAGSQANAPSSEPAISADSRFVAFSSSATNLVSGDTNGWSDVFSHGPYLTLETAPEFAVAGSALSFTTWAGRSRGLSLLVIVDINNAPLFIPGVLGSFDGAGMWVYSDTVPPGLAGNVMTFQTYGFTPIGVVQASNESSITFQ